MADISVLNTDSDLSAQTLLTAEGSHTVTGSQTFDRDPNPPFVVTSGSAVVTNLDSDKLDGQDGAYYLSLVNATNWATASLATTSFTPTWGNTGTANSLGNGTIAGVYFQIGKLVRFRITLTWGATTTSGSGSWTLSFPVATDGSAVATINSYILDSSAGAQYAGSGVNSSTTVFTPTYLSVSGTLIAHGGIAAATPMVWATGDQLIVTGTVIVP